MFSSRVTSSTSSMGMSSDEHHQQQQQQHRNSTASTTDPNSNIINYPHHANQHRASLSITNPLDLRLLSIFDEELTFRSYILLQESNSIGKVWQTKCDLTATSAFTSAYHRQQRAMSSMKTMIDVSRDAAKEEGARKMNMLLQQEANKRQALEIVVQDLERKLHINQTKEIVITRDLRDKIDQLERKIRADRQLHSTGVQEVKLNANRALAEREIARSEASEAAKKVDQVHVKTKKTFDEAQKEFERHFILHLKRLEGIESYSRDQIVADEDELFSVLNEQLFKFIREMCEKQEIKCQQDKHRVLTSIDHGLQKCLDLLHIDDSSNGEGDNENTKKKKMSLVEYYYSSASSTPVQNITTNNNNINLVIITSWLKEHVENPIIRRLDKDENEIDTLRNATIKLAQASVDQERILLQLQDATSNSLSSLSKRASTAENQIQHAKNFIDRRDKHRQELFEENLENLYKEAESRLPDQIYHDRIFREEEHERFAIMQEEVHSFKNEISFVFFKKMEHSCHTAVATLVSQLENEEQSMIKEAETKLNALENNTIETQVSGSDEIKVAILVEMNRREKEAARVLLEQQRKDQDPYGFATFVPTEVVAVVGGSGGSNSEKRRRDSMTNFGFEVESASSKSSSSSRNNIQSETLPTTNPKSNTNADSINNTKNNNTSPPKTIDNNVFASVLPPAALITITSTEEDNGEIPSTSAAMASSKNNDKHNFSTTSTQNLSSNAGTAKPRSSSSGGGGGRAVQRETSDGGLTLAFDDDLHPRSRSQSQMDKEVAEASATSLNTGGGSSSSQNREEQEDTKPAATAAAARKKLSSLHLKQLESLREAVHIATTRAEVAERKLTVVIQGQLRRARQALDQEKEKKRKQKLKRRNKNNRSNSNIHNDSFNYSSSSSRMMSDEKFDVNSSDDDDDDSDLETHKSQIKLLSSQLQDLKEKREEDNNTNDNNITSPTSEDNNNYTLHRSGRHNSQQQHHQRDEQEDEREIWAKEFEKKIVKLQREKVDLQRKLDQALAQSAMAEERRCAAVDRKLRMYGEMDMMVRKVGEAERYAMEMETALRRNGNSNSNSSGALSAASTSQGIGGGRISPSTLTGGGGGGNNNNNYFIDSFAFGGGGSSVPGNYSFPNTTGGSSGQSFGMFSHSGNNNNNSNQHQQIQIFDTSTTSNQLFNNTTNNNSITHQQSTSQFGQTVSSSSFGPTQPVLNSNNQQQQQQYSSSYSPGVLTPTSSQQQFENNNNANTSFGNVSASAEIDSVHLGLNYQQQQQQLHQFGSSANNLLANSNNINNENSGSRGGDSSTVPSSPAGSRNASLKHSIGHSTGRPGSQNNRSFLGGGSMGSQRWGSMAGSVPFTLRTAQSNRNQSLLMKVAGANAMNRKKKGNLGGHLSKSGGGGGRGVTPPLRRSPSYRPSPSQQERSSSTPPLDSGRRRGSIGGTTNGDSGSVGEGGRNSSSPVTPRLGLGQSSGFGSMMQIKERTLTAKKDLVGIGFQKA